MCSAVSTIQHLQQPTISGLASNVAAEAEDNAVPNAIVAEEKGSVQASSVLKYTKEERQLAGLARKMAMQQNVLYHGTRYAQSILRTGVLFTSDPGAPISLTRYPEVAAYFALLPRDDGEGRGAILIFDRERLRHRYRIHPVEEREVWFGLHNEAEEELWGDVTDVSNYLIGFISEPTTTHSYKTKKWNLERRMRTEARLNDLLDLVVLDWRYRSEEHIKSNLEKWERARKALFDGTPIPQVAPQVDLPVESVRRLAGRLRRHVHCKSNSMDAHLNWNLAQIVLSWDLSNLLKDFQKTANKTMTATDLVAVFGEQRINALVTYCGMSRDEVLDTLGRELPRLQIDAQRESAQTPTGPTPTLGSSALAALSGPSP